MSAEGGREFPTTSWSLIRRAATLEAPESRDALARLCRAYWEPLYAYLRRSGRSHEDAEDLVQSFFARLLEARRLEQLTPERGSFRGFLLVALKNFVSTAATKERTQKRGGGKPHLSFQLDTKEGDRRFHQESSSGRSADETYERRWALSVLAHVIDRLREERERAGDRIVFAGLEGFLPGGFQDESYESVGAKLNMTAGAVKVAVHRLRHRYRELLRAEIANLVDDPSEVDEEIRYLRNVLSR